MITYTEWQNGAKMPADASKARRTSVLIELTVPVTWLQTQETWPPERGRNLRPFDA